MRIAIIDNTTKEVLNVIVCELTDVPPIENTFLVDGENAEIGMTYNDDGTFTQ